MIVVVVFLFHISGSCTTYPKSPKISEGQPPKNAFYYIILKENIHSNLLTSGGQLSGTIVTSNVCFLDVHEPPTSDKISKKSNKTSIKWWIFLLRFYKGTYWWTNTSTEYRMCLVSVTKSLNLTSTQVACACPRFLWGKSEHGSILSNSVFWVWASSSLCFTWVTFTSCAC